MPQSQGMAQKYGGKTDVEDDSTLILLSSTMTSWVDLWLLEADDSSSVLLEQHRVGTVLVERVKQKVRGTAARFVPPELVA